MIDIIKFQYKFLRKKFFLVNIFLLKKFSMGVVV